jgi:DNA-binding NarL/FixJ family response regulator
LKVPPYRIVLADDHGVVREGMKRMIEEKTDLTVVGEAGDGLELLGLLENLATDLVVMDISMPNLRGIEATRELKRIRPEVKVLILTIHKDRDLVYQAISAGAEGFMVKEDTATGLFSAIEKIRQGGVYVSPPLAEELTEDWVRSIRSTSTPPPERLTTREREVLKLVAEGKSNREIASLLFVSVRTVEHHRASLRSKLGLRKAAELTKYAISKGYTLPDV